MCRTLRPLHRARPRRRHADQELGRQRTDRERHEALPGGEACCAPRCERPVIPPKLSPWLVEPHRDAIMIDERDEHRRPRRPPRRIKPDELDLGDDRPAEPLPEARSHG
jgi:hypothetical protein